MALPRTIPARNVASISVKAYVELPSCVESRRVQPISYAIAVAPTIAKQMLRKREGGEDGATSFFRGNTAAVGIVIGSWRESLSASAPANRLSATATPRVFRSPRVGKNKKPAANVPT